MIPWPWLIVVFFVSAIFGMWLESRPVKGVLDLHQAKLLAKKLRDDSRELDILLHSVDESKGGPNQ